MTTLITTTKAVVTRSDARMRLETIDGKEKVDLQFAPREISYAGIGWNWEEVGRPGRSAIVSPSAYKNKTMTFSTTLGGVNGEYVDQTPVIHALRRMVDSTSPVRITYGGEFDKWSWRITDFNFEATMHHPDTYVPLRIEVNLSFIQLRDALPVVGPVSSSTSSTPKTTTKPKTSTSPKKKTTTKRYYTVKKGDTLSKISLKYYKTASKWSKIASANKIKNPNKIYPGKKLLIP